MTKYVKELKNPCLVSSWSHLDVTIINFVNCVGRVVETESVSTSAPALGMETVLYGWFSQIWQATGLFVIYMSDDLKWKNKYLKLPRRVFLSISFLYNHNTSKYVFSEQWFEEQLHLACAMLKILLFIVEWYCNICRFFFRFKCNIIMYFFLDWFISNKNFNLMVRFLARVHGTTNQ